MLKHRKWIALIALVALVLMSLNTAVLAAAVGKININTASAEELAQLDRIVADHPDLATWTDVGDSWEKTDDPANGWDMMVLKLTRSAVPGPKPALFLSCAIHAREYTTAELCTRFAEELVAGYGSDADATWILDHHEVHLLLVTNPDGRKQAETGLSWRNRIGQTLGVEPGVEPSAPQLVEGRERTVGKRLRSEAVINGRTLKEGHMKFARPGLKNLKQKFGETDDQRFPAEWSSPAELPEAYRP